MSETKEEIRRQWGWEDREIERLNERIAELEAEVEELRAMLFDAKPASLTTGESNEANR